MIYVYSKLKSNGALELVRALGALRIRTFDGLDFYRRGKKLTLVPGDIIICWGSQVPEIDGVIGLNMGKYADKIADARELVNVGIPTINYSTIPTTGYLPRSRNHVGGMDLLAPPKWPDFWVQKLPIVNEYRIHSFCGRSIRAGKKILRDGFIPATGTAPWGSAPNIAHPWVRSYDAGWRIFYDNFKSSKTMRSLAAKAVKALDLDFGAVDIGELENGNFVVLEVNRAPGLEGGTIEAYARNIQKWIDKKPAEPEDSEAEEGENEGQNMADIIHQQARAREIAELNALRGRDSMTAALNQWGNFPDGTVRVTTRPTRGAPTPQRRVTPAQPQTHRLTFRTISEE